MNGPRRCTPAVLLSQRVARDPATGEARDALSHDWAVFADRCGLLPIPAPASLEYPAALLDALRPAALVLTGGGDVGADDLQPGSALYRTPLALLSPEQRRDRCEAILLRAAVERGIPVLGVCRGMQFINMFFSGRMQRNVTPPEGSHPRPGATHAVHRCSALPFGVEPLAPPSTVVRSFHDHAIFDQDLAPSFAAAARADDGVVEAMAHASLPILGVQWHPEREPDHPWNPAIRSFLRSHTASAAAAPEQIRAA